MTRHSKMLLILVMLPWLAMLILFLNGTTVTAIKSAIVEDVDDTESSEGPLVDLEGVKDSQTPFTNNVDLPSDDDDDRSQVPKTISKETLDDGSISSVSNVQQDQLPNKVKPKDKLKDKSKKQRCILTKLLRNKYTYLLPLGSYAVYQFVFPLFQSDSSQITSQPNAGRESIFTTKTHWFFGTHLVRNIVFIILCIIVAILFYFALRKFLIKDNEEDENDAGDEEDGNEEHSDSDLNTAWMTPFLKKNKNKKKKPKRKEFQEKKGYESRQPATIPTCDHEGLGTNVDLRRYQPLPPSSPSSRGTLPTEMTPISSFALNQPSAVKTHRSKTLSGVDRFIDPALPSLKKTKKKSPLHSSPRSSLYANQSNWRSGVGNADSKITKKSESANQVGESATLSNAFNATTSSNIQPDSTIDTKIKQKGSSPKAHPSKMNSKPKFSPKTKLPVKEESESAKNDSYLP